MTRATSANRVLLMCVAVAALTSACASTPQQPTINVALAQVRSAELDAANVYYETTLTAAGDELRSHVLAADAFRRIYSAGADLHRALTLAHAEHVLYLAGGNNLATYDAAFADLKRARMNLGLIWSAAHGRT